VMVLPSHSGNGATTQGCTSRVRLRNPFAQSIEVLSQCEEVGMA
jgi:hypothetical protein